MNLRDWAQVALEKCSSEDRPVSLHWLDHAENDFDEDWCYECARLLCDYFNGEGERPETVWDGEEIPDWEPTPSSVEVDGCGAIESDSTRFCNRCGRRLEFSPTDYYMENELTHFESCAPKNDWYSFYVFLDGMHGYKRVKPDWHARALVLARKYLASACLEKEQS